jgi:hypothetical protein
MAAVVAIFGHWRNSEALGCDPGHGSEAGFDKGIGGKSYTFSGLGTRCSRVRLYTRHTDILRPSILHFDGQFLTVRLDYYAWRQIYWFVVRGAWCVVADAGGKVAGGRW